MLDPDGLPLSCFAIRMEPPPRSLSRCRGHALHARIWKVAVGRVTLLLLDTDVPETRSSSAP